ncbi:hypothetical protein HYPSUDRAFT_204937 [Hypholoma sublateritium FD-334 SS-4]|uniref:Uncharacterized protein n=1 Tax=Hypholoma sublateritium (strain FD-334 SS-4) TaxID=945553 RepID=A0A0D2NQH2_HYPSF|nr:hypothetical protein HYPSUDRAFT_204937 [Hypholoma sublateritium FD-334 SS-4]
MSYIHRISPHVICAPGGGAAPCVAGCVVRAHREQNVDDAGCSGLPRYAVLALRRARSGSSRSSAHRQHITSSARVLTVRLYSHPRVGTRIGAPPRSRASIPNTGSRTHSRTHASPPTSWTGATPPVAVPCLHNDGLRHGPALCRDPGFQAKFGEMLSAYPCDADA